MWNNSPLLNGEATSQRKLTKTQWAVRGLAAAVVTAGVSFLLWHGGRSRALQKAKVVRIAHVGNSFQFVNDFPRMLPRLAAPTRTIEQDSVLHGSLSLVSLLKKGNGMLNRWATKKAWNETLQMYDYGACTVPQLLIGRDDYLESGNYNEYYKNDGKNPCFPQHDGNNNYDDDFYLNDDDNVDDAQDDDDNYQYNENDDDKAAYLEYTIETKMGNGKSWDYVIFNDQSLRPAIRQKRDRSMVVLNNTYSDLLMQAGATPVFMATHAYWRTDINVTALYGIRDVPHFTAKVQLGYEMYANTLIEASSSVLQPLVAPVGIAYLTVWEQNRQLWNKFFGPDLFHPSPHGTYLLGCVIHATIFGILPEPPTSVNTIANYFSRARSMHLSGYSQPFPTHQEALYLRWVARRVVFRNYRPPSFQEAWAAVLQEEEDYGDYR